MSRTTGYHHSKETRAKMGEANKRRKYSEETRAKLRLAQLGRHPSEETRTKMGKAQKGRIISPEHRLRLSEANKGYVFSKEHKAKIRAARKNQVISEETKRKLSQTSLRLWQNEQFASQWRKALMSGMHIRPNKPERILLDLLNLHYPGQWGYVGDGSLIIAGLNPDFMNREGTKIIEVFGDYWHGQAARSWKATEDGRKDIFNSHGYMTLIIWESELEDSERALTKLTEFCIRGIE